MSKTEAQVLEAADRIARQVIAPAADQVDREGSFPRAAMDALAEAGLLGLTVSRDVGGLGYGPRVAALVVARIARECSSTAMVTTMHYAATAVLEKLAPEAVCREVAAGRHLSTLAFSEVGSRSMFWAPVSTAQKSDRGIRLNARKSWVTSARHATSYVWSSKPVAVEGASTIWLVERETAGLRHGGSFDGAIPESNRLGEDGQGLSVMLEMVLPIFNLLSAACSVGLMEAATGRTATHASGVRYEHTGSALADLPTIRASIARMRIATDMARCLLLDTAAAIESGREDTMLRVLECKAAAAESATEVTDLAMRVCGGAAFRKDVAVERYFRDGRAANVMAPTTDQLYDFIGKALCGLPVF
jgi:alkylation response protein AidB-like acyl-CoA dehydrogenase